MRQPRRTLSRWVPPLVCDALWDVRSGQSDAGARARLLPPGVGQPGGDPRGGARGLRPGPETAARRPPPGRIRLPDRALGLHRLARDRGAATLAVAVLADRGRLPVRRAARARLHPGAHRSAPRGWSDLVRAVP